MKTKPNQPVRGVVFDLDGTLVDSLSVTFAAFNHGIVSQGGIQHEPLELMKYFGPGEDKIFAAILGCERKAEDAYLACRQYLDDNLDRVPLHSGILDLLEELKRRSIPISIFTGRSWNTTEVILKYHGMLDRFVTVIANDHVGNPKPSPEGLHLALTRMNMEPSEVLFVGDTWTDMRAAQSAGARGIAALWDLMADRDQMAAYAPYHYVERPAEILQLVD